MPFTRFVSCRAFSAEYLRARNFFCAAFVFCACVLILASFAPAQTPTLLYNFGAHTGDPLYPFWEGIIAQGRDGNLYSTTMDGGANGWGATFKITTGGSLSVPFSFSADGTPEGGLILGADGNFYGTTQSGGANTVGQIFKLTPTGTLTVLYTFSGGSDGSGPFASPIQGADGNFYGTVTSGGTGFGTVYKMTPTGTLTTLHSFASTDGANPHAPLLLGNDNNLYGTTWVGGTSGKGVMFKITPGGAFRVLFNFDGTHGANPNGPLVQGTDGNFYGTTTNGGIANSGVVFKITAGGKLTVLHSLNGTGDGSQPLAGLVQATDGNFYGSASAGGSSVCSGGCGTIFKITLPSTFSTVYSFDDSSGASPAVTMIQHTNGLLYGDAENGGSACAAPGCGVFFSLNLGLNPFVSLVYTSGKIGKVVEILGQGFIGATAVSFNGAPATFKVASNTFLMATVPSGATTGFVTVTTPSGTLTSNSKFRVLPFISSFTPSSGPPGTRVVITGSGLTGTNRVAFGGVAATTFTVNSDTQVTATVPAGAATGRITVTTPTGSASSSASFSVTPSNCASGATTEVRSCLDSPVKSPRSST
jgi:uncharacterized repeat protein (TIGR03803 family)